MNKVGVGTDLNHLEYEDRLMVFTSAMAITMHLRERSLQERLRMQSKPLAMRAAEVRKRLKGLKGSFMEALRQERDDLVGRIEDARELAEESKARCTFYQSAHKHCRGNFDNYHKYFRLRCSENPRPQRDLAEAIYIRYRRQLERKAWRYLEKQFPNDAEAARAAQIEFSLDKKAA